MPETSRPRTRSSRVSGCSRSSSPGPTGSARASVAHSVRNAATTSSGSVTSTGSTSCPRDSSRAAVSSAAATHTGSTSAPAHAGPSRPERSPYGTAVREPDPPPRARGTAHHAEVAPGGGAGATSDSPATTGRRTARRAAPPRRRRSGPADPRPTAPPGRRPPGPAGTRPRVVLSPTSPHTDAGMRIDPPPSRALRDRQHPARHRRRRPARGPARRARDVPRGHRGRRVGGLGVAGQPELGHGRLADAHGAGVAQEPDEVVVVRRAASPGRAPTRGR